MTDQIVETIVKSYLQTDVTNDTPIFGVGSEIDSMTLVGLLIDIEQQIFDDLGVQIVIASDRAVSQHRSPFRTLGTLKDFINILVTENK